MNWQLARPIIGIAILGLVLWWADSAILRALITGGLILVGAPIMWARSKRRARKRQGQRRHNETIAAIRNQPPPAPDLTDRGN